MKKILGMIIAIMMLIISSPLNVNNTLGDPTSDVDVLECAPVYEDRYIAIINMEDKEVWNSTIGGPPHDRSQALIFPGETLVIDVKIYDANGIDPNTNIEAFLNPLNFTGTAHYLGKLVFDRYIDDYHAIFKNITTMPGTLHCLHNISITINEGPDIYILDKLFINPEVAGIFSDPSVGWGSLNLGDADIDALGNPYSYNLSAYCRVYDTATEYHDEYVDIPYNLNISGTNMTQGDDIIHIIPHQNIKYNMTGDPYPLPLTSTLIATFPSNIAQDINFTITIPLELPSGHYQGQINFDTGLIL